MTLNNHSPDLPGRPADRAMPDWLEDRIGQDDVAGTQADDSGGPVTQQAARRAWDAVGELADMPELQARLTNALHNASQEMAERRRAFRKRLEWGGMVAASLILATGIGIFMQNRTPAPDVYQTRMGERRTVTLADNSRIFLDQSSKVEVVYTSGARQLRLLDGQAEFDVAKNKQRPFSVSAGTYRVVATGTLFNVDLTRSEVRVSLLRGGVLVAPDDAALESGVALHPMERLTIDRAAGRAEKGRIDGDDILAWQKGKLIFDAEPLALAVERVNRYSDEKVVLDAAIARGGTVMGVFNVGDAEAFAQAIAAQFGTGVKRQEKRIIVTSN